MAAKNKLALPLDFPSPTEHLTVSQMEQWLWDAACVIRGAADAPKYKDFILPLVFYKRLCDVYEDEFAEKVADFGDEEMAQAIIEEDHAAALKEGRSLIIRFFVPAECAWKVIRNHAADSKLGEFVTECFRTVARLNPELGGVLDVKDFAETQSGQRTLDNERLEKLSEIISCHRLGLSNTQPDVLGHAYEYLLRKFAEGQGQSASEFYTPAEVALMMGQLLDAPPYATVYDPTCGSGGLLIKARTAFEAKHPDKKAQAPKPHGQELNPVTYAMARMNMILHDFGGSRFMVGDTFRNPGFSAKGAGLTTFHRCVANPMWNQKGYPDSFYEGDGWNRFVYGLPPSSSADWAWVQHILASLKEGGRAAVVPDTGAVSCGSGGDSASCERTIRRAVVEADRVEGVILLPENLFYNTSAPEIVLLLAKGKPDARKGQMLLVNASQFFVKRCPKNELTEAGAAAVVEAFAAWQTTEKFSRVLTLDEVRAADFNLSLSQFVEVGERKTHRPLSEILADLDDAKAEHELADAHLSATLARLGLTGAKI